MISMGKCDASSHSITCGPNFALGEFPAHSGGMLLLFLSETEFHSLSGQQVYWRLQISRQTFAYLFILHEPRCRRIFLISANRFYFREAASVGTFRDVNLVLAASSPSRTQPFCVSPRLPSA